MWTLTQTDEALWYHTYTIPGHAGGEGGGGGRKRKVALPAPGPSKSGKRLKGEAAEVKEEEQDYVPVTPEQDSKEEEMLRDYFQLKVKLGDLYREWGGADPHFKNISNIFTGRPYESE